MLECSLGPAEMIGELTAIEWQLLTSSIFRELDGDVGPPCSVRMTFHIGPL